MTTKSTQKTKSPKLRFPEFSDEWEEKRIRDLQISVSDGNYGEMYPKSNEMQESGIPFIRANNIKDNKVVWDDMKYIDEELHEVLKSGHLEEADILVTTRGDIGMLAYVDKEFDNANINAQICLMRCGSEINPKYLLNYLSSKIGKKQFKELQTGSALKQLPKGNLAKIRIRTPSKLEQQKIASFLTSVDDWISNLKAQKETLEQYKKGMMQRIYTGSLRINNKSSQLVTSEGYIPSKLGAFPEDWSLVRLKDVLWFQEGPGVRTSQFTKAGIKLFNGTNIQRNQIVLDNTETHISEVQARNEYRHFLIDTGDLVIACSGISVDRFDEKVAFVRTEHLPLCMNTSTMRFKTLDNQILNITFFSYFIRTRIFKNQVRRQITGSAQLNFGPSHVSSFYLPLPPIEEQQKIADFLTSVDTLINSKQLQISKAEEWKRGLMQGLFV